MQPSVNQLLMGADWACAHGDAGGLGEVARQLAARSPGWLVDALAPVRDAAARHGDPFACWAEVGPAVRAHFRGTA